MSAAVCCRCERLTLAPSRCATSSGRAAPAGRCTPASTARRTSLPARSPRKLPGCCEPDSPPDPLSAKIRASLTYYRSLVGAPGCEVRLHDTTLYNPSSATTTKLLVNPHIWGQPASANPLFQLRRMSGTDWCDRYTDSFKAVWNTARPWAPDCQEHHPRGQD